MKQAYRDHEESRSEKFRILRISTNRLIEGKNE